ncbi:MAG: DUF2141 domain-containing protein [Paracoccaceae bacterium]
MTRFKTAISTFAVFLFLGGAAVAQGLTLTIDNIRNNKGKIVVLVFDSAKGFDNLDENLAIDYAEAQAKKGGLRITFPALTGGPYAAFLFHDENGDYDVNHRGGRLLEGIGATGVQSEESMPGFAEASVNAGKVRVRMYYQD